MSTVRTEIGPYGGNISIRLPIDSKPRLYFGQDEAIYRSSQLNECCWTVDGETTLRTKGLGTGVMVSAMVSRAFGFGLYGSSAKKSLIDNPFVRYLDYGSRKDGYWTYRHMVVQIEDCSDCLRYLFPQFDYGIELDHSSGHNAERPDGLSTTPIFDPTAPKYDQSIEGLSVTRKH